MVLPVFPLRNQICVGRTKEIALIETTKPVCSVSVMHYGTKPGHFETSKIHFPTSEEVSEVSERASAAEGASEASSPEQANK